MGRRSQVRSRSRTSRKRSTRASSRQVRPGRANPPNDPKRLASRGDVGTTCGGDHGSLLGNREGGRQMRSGKIRQQTDSRRSRRRSARSGKNATCATGRRSTPSQSACSRGTLRSRFSSTTQASPDEERSSRRRRRRSSACSKRTTSAASGARGRCYPACAGPPRPVRARTSSTSSRSQAPPLSRRQERTPRRAPFLGGDGSHGCLQRLREWRSHSFPFVSLGLFRP